MSIEAQGTARRQRALWFWKGTALEEMQRDAGGGRVVSIDAAVRQHFADIGHDETRHDITYENSQLTISRSGCSVDNCGNG